MHRPSREKLLPDGKGAGADVVTFVECLRVATKQFGVHARQMDQTHNTLTRAAPEVAAPVIEIEMVSVVPKSPQYPVWVALYASLLLSGISKQFDAAYVHGRDGSDRTAKIIISGCCSRLWRFLSSRSAFRRLNIIAPEQQFKICDVCSLASNVVEQQPCSQGNVDRHRLCIGQCSRRRSAMLEY